MRLMLDNFHSFTVSLLSHLFKKKIEIYLQLTALEPKRQKKSKKRYRLQRESWAEKRKKKKEEEGRRRKKKEEEEEEEEEET